MQKISLLYYLTVINFSMYFNLLIINLTVELLHYPSVFGKFWKWLKILLNLKKKASEMWYSIFSVKRRGLHLEQYIFIMIVLLEFIGKLWGFWANLWTELYSREKSTLENVETHDTFFVSDFQVLKCSFVGFTEKLGYSGIILWT